MHDGYQTSPEGHRGTRAVQRLVEYAPASGSLALWMRHRDVDAPPPAARALRSERARRGIGSGRGRRTGRDVADEEGGEGDWLLGNDGLTIWYGAAFERRPLAEQTALVAHQVLHVALRHVPRERELRGVLGDVDGELFNLCADAIVNTALSHLDWLELPPRSVLLDELLERLLGERTSADTALLRWDTESLYRAIDDRGPPRAAPSRSGEGHGGGGGRDERAGGGGGGRADAEAGADGPSTSGGAADADVGAHGGARAGRGARDDADAPENGADGGPEDGPIATLARRLAATQARDLFPGAGDEAPEREAAEARRWSERLARAHASDAGQSLLRQLVADRSTPRTPWEQILRTRLARSLAQSPELSWSRPTRSWLANRGRTANGRRLPWQPGTSGTRAVPRLAVVVDVSGSIETRVLGRFASELDRLMRVHRAEIHLIVGDDRVRHESRLVPGCRALIEPFGRASGDEAAGGVAGTSRASAPPAAGRGLGTAAGDPSGGLLVDGGGGTDFAPLLEAAAARRPDAVVVLTDLDGPAGDAPPWPVIWALLPGHPVRQAPFGLVVPLD